MNKPNQFQFEWISDWEIISGNDFQQRWLSIYEQATESTIFFHPALCMAWIETYRPLRKMNPLFCIATKEDKLIFFPLVLWKKNWKNAFQHLLVPVGYSDFDYHDPLLIGKLSSEEINIFWNEIINDLSVFLKYDRFLIDNLHLKWISPTFKIINTVDCPYITLNGNESINDFRKSLSSGLNKDINRSVRKLCDLGPLSFKIFEENEMDDAWVELKQMLIYHQQRYPLSYIAKGFHENLLFKGIENKLLLFSVLKMGGVSISWRFDLFNQNSYYGYLPTIHPDYHQFSLGKIHHIYCMDYAISKKIPVYDLLRGAKAYKKEWTQFSTEICNVECYGNTYSKITNNILSFVKSKASHNIMDNSIILSETNISLWQFEWITDWDTVSSDAFMLQWLDYYDQANQSHVFFHPALGKAWIETYRPLQHIEPLFCVARYKGTTIFFPLIRWKRNWKNAFQRLIIPLGYSDFDYHDPLVIGTSKFNKERFYSELLKEITRIYTFDKIELNGLRDNVNLSGWIKEDLFCPYYSIGKFNNTEEFLNSLKTGLRGDLRRQIRKLNEKGVLSIHSYSANSFSNALDILDYFLKIHKLRWPNAYKAPGFHKRILENGLNAGVVDFTDLRIDNIPISWHLGFADKGRYYYYIPVIDPAFANYSPGKVHLLFLKYQSIENGIEIFDHLIGDENYKAGWTNHIQPLYRYTQKSTKRSSIIRNWLAETGKHLIKIQVTQTPFG